MIIFSFSPSSILSTGTPVDLDITSGTGAVAIQGVIGGTAALATLDEVKTLMDKGMSTDEIMNVLQSTPRRKQAEGGLSYLMGM